MEAIEAEVHKNSSYVVSYGRRNTQIGLLTLSPFLKRIEKSGSILTTTNLMQPALKTSSYCPSLMS